MNPSEPSDTSRNSLEARIRKVRFQSPPEDLRALCLGTGVAKTAVRRVADTSAHTRWNLGEWFRPYRLAWGTLGMVWVATFGFWFASTSVYPTPDVSATFGLSKETEQMAVQQRTELMVLLEVEMEGRPRVADRPKLRPTKAVPNAPRSALGSWSIHV